MGLAWLIPFAGPFDSLAWIVLLVSVVRREPRQAAVLSFVAGLLHIAIAFHWVPQTVYETTHLGILGAIAGFIAFVFWEAVPFAAIGFFAAKVARNGGSWLFLLVPTWVSMEIVWPKVFPWSIAHTYLDYPAVIQIAEVGKTPGVAIVVMAGNVALTVWAKELWRIIGRHDQSNDSSTRRLSRGTATITLVLVISSLGWGVYRDFQVRLSLTSQSNLRVALVQVDPNDGESVQRMRKLSDSVDGHIDLYVWPESALGIYHVSLTNFRDELRTTELSEAPNPALDPYPNNRSELLAGGKTYEEGGRDRGPYRNNAFLIDSHKQIIGRTAKRTLMPIGEYMPLENWLSWFRQPLALETNLIQGTDFEPLTLKDGTRIGVMVCYEDTDPATASAIASSGTEILIGLINASAFLSPITLDQHLRLARLRAVENRCWFLRCSSTGVTCVIDPTGRIQNRLPVNQEGVLVAEIPRS